MFLFSSLQLLKKQPSDWSEGGSSRVEGSPAEKELLQYYSQITQSTIGW